MVAAILLEKVSKVFQQAYAVKELSFSIEAGEMFGLLGPNGAGKSTTIRMLITLTELTEGRAEVEGMMFFVILDRLSAILAWYYSK